MNNTQKQKTPTPDKRQIHNLVAANVETNRKIRPQVQSSTNNPKDDLTRSSFQQQVSTDCERPSSTPQPLLDCLLAQPLLTSKPYEKNAYQRRRNQKFPNRTHENARRNENDEIDKTDVSPRKNEIGRSTIDIRQPTIEHLSALRVAIDKVLTECFLPEPILKQRYSILTKLRQVISDARPDCQIQLYGSHLFECCLDKKNFIDIDIQFKETLQYDTLKELIEIVNKSDLCQKAEIDTEHKPSCINLIIKEPNMGVRITSGHNRGYHLSKLIRIYTTFDSRLIQLLRLFRYFAKICNIDQTEIGTLHPIVFHLLVIHFLQQVDQPVLPCLHEYAYGIDHVPMTLNDNQYGEFFRVSQEYSRVWKSRNTTSVELLFLQLLSYYVKTFNTKQFVVSIQTRMPVVKTEKNWHSRKLLVEDPTDIKRSLCQTMQSMRSIDYFRDVLNAALNYFGRKQKPKVSHIKSTDPNDEDFIEIVTEDETPKNEPNNSLHNSYRLFYKRLPASVARDLSMKQNRVRDYYRQTFDEKENLVPKGIIRFDSSNDTLDNFICEENQEGFQHDLETMEENDEELNENHSDLLERRISINDDETEQSLNEPIDIEQNKEIATRELFPENDNEEKIIENNPPTVDQEQENVINNPAKESDEKPIPDTEISVESNKIDSTLSPLSICQEKVNPIVNCVNDDISSSIEIKEASTIKKDPPTKHSTEFFYDFQSENFHAEQGAPYVCLTCNGIGHLKSECPELVVPKMDILPKLSEDWLNILSSLCHQITERFQPTELDIGNREKILDQLKKQFQKDCPDCHLSAFGSFYNGFGFRQSDLDVCFVFKDQREQKNDEVVRILKKLLQSMRSSNTFDNVQPVLHAKVPIIRSRHRQFKIDIDISLHNTLAIENTRLLKTYTQIDSRVSQLGYMIKHLAKFCDIGDASRGTISSYAYIIMLIHFLQQIQPPVLPALQQLTGNPNDKSPIYRKCSQWNVYFYDDLTKIKEIWPKKNQLSTGALWIEFLRYYTEQFNYDEHIVCIRQVQPLLRHDKGWFRRTLAIEDPFELTHNLAGGLHMRNWTIIRRVFISARQRFAIQPNDINISQPDMKAIEATLFDIDILCPQNAPKLCEWCKGPYHIRKRCPKLAQLANEQEKQKRIQLNKQRPNSTIPTYSQFPPNHYRQNGPMYPAQYNHSNHQNSNMYTPVDQRPMTITTLNDGTRIFPNHSQRPIEQFNQSYYHENAYGRQCFACGGYDHIKANCLHPRSKNNQRQKHGH